VGNAEDKNLLKGLISQKSKKGSLGSGRGVLFAREGETGSE